MNLNPIASVKAGRLGRLLVLFTMTGLCACEDRHQPQSSLALAFTGVTVIDVRTGARHPSQTVVIAGSRIVEVGPSSQVGVPSGAAVVAADGQFVIPGLWDMHTHAASTQGRTARMWALFRAHGVTGTREMGNDMPSIQLGKAQAGQMPDRAPRVVWSSPMLDGDPPTYASSIAIANAAQARLQVRAVHAGGVEFLKVYNGLSRASFLALADEARQLGIPIAGEVPDAVSPGEAAESGMRSFEHLWNLFEHCVPGAATVRDALRRPASSAAATHALQDRRDRLWLTAYDRSCAATLTARLRQAGTWQVPTLRINRTYSHITDEWRPDDPRRKWLPAAVLARWEKLRADTLAAFRPETAAAWRARYAAEAGLVRQFSEAGIGILAGSDATDWEPQIYPGSSLHDELALLVDVGLSPVEALRAATFNAAIFLGRTDHGEIAAGKVADLVLLDADPLSDIRNVSRIRAVVFNGRLQTRVELDALIADAAALAGRAP